jgi:hypothetical protein
MHKLTVKRMNSPEQAAAEQDEVAHDGIEDGLHVRRRA